MLLTENEPDKMPWESDGDMGGYAETLFEVTGIIRDRLS